MKNKALKIAALLLVVLVPVVLYVQQDTTAARPDKAADNLAAAELNTHLASPGPDEQSASAAPAVADENSGNNAGEQQPSEGSDKATGADGDSISLDEILSRIHISKDNNVFPQQYQLDIATTARLTDLISQLDKDQLQLHVFSAECYHTLNECRVHYQANDSLVLYFMGKFEGMIQVGDHVTESGDTVLMIGYRPVDADNNSRADK